MPRAYYRHAVVHHGLTFRKNHVTQFVSVEERAAVDRITERAADERIRGERYGLTVGLRAFVTYNLTVLPIIALKPAHKARKENDMMNYAPENQTTRRIPLIKAAESK